MRLGLVPVAGLGGCRSWQFPAPALKAAPVKLSPFEVFAGEVGKAVATVLRGLGEVVSVIAATKAVEVAHWPYSAAIDMEAKRSG